MNVNELKNNLGQYQLYDVILSTEHPNHRLYLAISEQAYRTIFSTWLSRLSSTEIIWV